jgi:hypothetical protein
MAYAPTTHRVPGWRARYARTDWGPFVAAAGLSLLGALLV